MRIRLGNERDGHYFIKVKFSKMNNFISHVMPGTPPNQASTLSTLIMAAARAKSAAFIRFIYDDHNKVSCWWYIILVHSTPVQQYQIIE